MSDPVSVPPIPMRLTCPDCGELHLDEGVFATKPHHEPRVERLQELLRAGHAVLPPEEETR